MEILAKFVPFVNEQFSFHETMAARHAADPRRAEKHLSTAAILKELGDAIALAGAQYAIVTSELKEAKAAAAPALAAGAPKKKAGLYLSLDEIEGLPPELIQELSFSDGDRTDYTILRLIDECGGVASIDRIVLGLYRKTGEVMKRSTLTSRLYRLSQKGQIFPVSGKKGVYADKELTPEEINELE